MSAPGHQLKSRAVPLAAVLIAAAGALAYAGSFAGPFIFDDVLAIVRNPSIRDLCAWPGPLAPPHGHAGATVQGRPILNLSLAINYAINGTQVWSYHALNLAIHLCAGLALFGIARRTIARWSALSPTGSATSVADKRVGDNALHPVLLAFFIALLWTVHPLQTESVTYIVQRAESLMGLFYLLTLYCFIRATESDQSLSAGRGAGLPSGPLPAATEETRRRQPTLSSAGVARHEARQRGDGEAEGRVPKGWPWRAPEGPPGPQHRLWYILSFFACLLGMGTKEVMVTAPVMILFHDRTFLAGTFREAWRQRRRYYLALAATWLPLAGLIAATGGNRGGSVGFGANASWGAYLLTQPEAIARYLRLAAWPHPLVFEYGPVLVRPAAALPAFLLVAALGAATIWALVRRPALGFLGFWFFGILAVTSLVPGTTQMIVEHRMYLPLAAVVTAFVLAADRLLAGRSGWLIGAAVVASIVLTAARNRDYRDAVSIWSDTVARRPGNALAQDALGTALVDAGRPEEAIARYQRALQLAPAAGQVHYNLGKALERAGRLDEAISEYAEAVRLDPSRFEAEENLSVAFAKRGDYARAAEEAERALRIEPGNAEGHFNLGLILFDERRPDDAVREFARTLQLAPGNSRAHNALGAIFAMSGRRAEAIAQFQEALRLQPDFPEARANLLRLTQP